MCCSFLEKSQVKVRTQTGQQRNTESSLKKTWLYFTPTVKCVLTKKEKGTAKQKAKAKKAESKKAKTEKRKEGNKMSTRANLKLVSSNKNEKSYYLRKWHDGYGVGEFLKTILTGFKEDGEEIKIESLAEVLQSGLNCKEDSDFDYELLGSTESGTEKFETGFETIFTDWVWTCFLIGNGDAVITGSDGSTEVVIKV